MWNLTEEADGCSHSRIQVLHRGCRHSVTSWKFLVERFFLPQTKIELSTVMEQFLHQGLYR